jgi:hypothetical protein
MIGAAALLWTACVVVPGPGPGVVIEKLLGSTDLGA